MEISPTYFPSHFQAAPQPHQRDPQTPLSCGHGLSAGDALMPTLAKPGDQGWKWTLSLSLRGEGGRGGGVWGLGHLHLPKWKQVTHRL